jgi:hypothetical protein
VAHRASGRNELRSLSMRINRVHIRPYSGSEKVSLETNTQEASPLTMAPTGIESIVIHCVSLPFFLFVRYIEASRSGLPSVGAAIHRVTFR